MKSMGKKDNFEFIIDIYSKKNKEKCKEENLESIIEYAQNRKEDSNSVEKIKYILFLIKQNIDKLENVNDLINIVLEMKIDDFGKGYYGIKNAIQLSTIMKIKWDEIDTFIDKISNKQDFIVEISDFKYKKYGEEELRLFLEEIIKSYNYKSYKYSFIDIAKKYKNLKNLIYQTLGEKSLEEANKGDKHEMYKYMEVQNAINYFSVINNKEMLERCKPYLEKSISSLGKNLQETVFTVPIEDEEKEYLMEIYKGYKKIDFYKKLDWATQGLKLTKDGVLLCTLPTLHIPEIENDNEMSFLSLFEKPIIINQDRVVSTDNNSEENMIKEITYGMYCSFSVIPIIDIIKKDESFNKENLMNYFNKSNLFEHEKLILEELIDNFVGGKNISFMYSVIPIIEKTLRKIYKFLNNHKSIIKNKNPETQVCVNLTDILNNELVINEIGTVKIMFLKWLLNLEAEGYNFRNNICHGISTDKTFTNENSYLLFFVLLMIVNSKIKMGG